VDDLKRQFRERYEVDPTLVVRAPGRVNLIGEHIDYAGLPVFPMALQREVRILARPRDDSIILAATTDPGYGPCHFEVGERIEPYPDGDWGNYLKAAVKGMAVRYGISRGFDALVESTVPVAAGLSSSSALVIATALTAAAANDTPFDPLDLAELMAESEQYVGTRGGGMDQAISTGARAGCAARVEFNPLRIEPVPVPEGWRFVVANSLVQAHKSGAAREGYNRRRAETEEALARVASALGFTGRDVRSYRDLLERANAAEAFTSATDLLEGDLLRRFRHVVTEGERVVRAEVAMREDSPAAFGMLMNGSHSSLRDDFEVSSQELDELVRIAREAGAAGARLTGAGMGGCIVALCSGGTEGAETVTEALAERFYAERAWEGELTDHMFVAEPAAGASAAGI
jgi:galactokinase